MNTQQPPSIALVVFPGFTSLDALGPYQVLAHIPGHPAGFVAAERGSVSDGLGLSITVPWALDDVPSPEVVVVAGGVPAIAMARDGDPIVDWLRAVAPTARWITSVCTGSLLLGAAGLLDGIEATSHWSARGMLSHHGAIPTNRRVVEVGNVITAAGVSAGIDMALLLASRLVGEHIAQMIQLDMEYAPEPPFEAGTPESAPAAVTTELSAMYATAFPHAAAPPREAGA